MFTTRKCRVTLYRGDDSTHASREPSHEQRRNVSITLENKIVADERLRVANAIPRTAMSRNDGA